MELRSLVDCGSLQRVGIGTLYEIRTYSRWPEYRCQASSHTEDFKMSNHQAVKDEIRGLQTSLFSSNVSGIANTALTEFKQCL